MPEIRLFEEEVEGVAGFFSNRERGVQIPMAKVTEAMNLIYNGEYNGKTLMTHERDYLIREALTTADFPYLFGDVLDRQVLANYKAVDPVWKAFVRTSTVRDFRDNYRFAITGGDQYLARVYEKGEYLASDREEERFTISVGRYGRQFDISWESLVNDDLGALKDTPERFARAAVRTEHRVVTTIYAGDVGTHTANANLYEEGVNASANALTIGNLETALETMHSLTDDGSEPIMNRMKYLVVVPSLEMTARQILTSANKMWLADSDDVTPPAAYPTANVVRNMGLTLIIDPYLPIIDTTSDDEAWYLFADPRDVAAIEVAHLQGHERPEICMKASDKVTVGGGAINPLSGDFATDNVFYRVRLVFGATALDWRGTYMGGYQG